MRERKTFHENHKNRFCRYGAAAALFLTVFLASAPARAENSCAAPSEKNTADEALAERIAPHILRFHVLANSDSPKDQALKFEVRDLLLKEITAICEEDSPNAGQAGALSRQELCRRIIQNRSELEAHAEALAAARGFDYPVTVRLERCEFPERTYGGLTFPAGVYDAVRVRIGSGNGKNFWCVLYPSLCYLDCTHAVVPGESREYLKNVLPEDDFSALLSAQKGGADTLSAQENESGALFAQNDKAGALPSHRPRIEIRFRLLELFR